MSDMRSVSNTTGAASDEYLEQLRQKIGTEFTDKKQTGKKRNELGKDDFIRLMSAQLKHQDPISPVKNEEMAAQLAQFSSLEQMVNVNQNLEKMTANQKPQDNVLAASLIGKRVMTDSSKFSFVGKGQQPEMRFELPADAERVTVSVVSEKGEVLREYEMGGVKKGFQSIKWDGKNGKAQEQGVGEYTFRVNATDAHNKPVLAKTSTSGLVSGVVFEGGKPLLLVEDKKIPLDVVGRIEADMPVNKPAASNQDPGMDAAIADAVKQLTGSKQNSSITSSDADAEKNTESAKKNLRTASNTGKINNTGAQSSQSMDGQAIEQEGMSDNNGAFPLWNPSNM
jgi:flagellar basal-body rod modification protein FlgD